MVSATPATFAARWRGWPRGPRGRRRGRARRARRDAAAARGAVLVTFDDAYADFAEHAWPVLRAHGISPLLFVPTAFPGDPGGRSGGTACTPR